MNTLTTIGKRFVDMVRRTLDFVKRFFENRSIRYTIFLSFTISAAVAILSITVSLYTRFSNQVKLVIQEENQNLIEQVNKTLDSNLRNLMKISDSLYYQVIKYKDLSTESINEKLLLIYDTNKDYIQNIALFLADGELIETAPAAMLKDGVSVVHNTWFQYALNKTENIHFTTPYVQNLFVDSDYQYQWVISISRAVEITMEKTIQQGVLLIDISYDAIAHLFENISLGSDGYTYLMDSEGVIIYHPKQQLIHAKVLQENNLVAANYKDGNHEETFMGDERVVTVKSVGYTGWKIVGVTPQKGLTLNNMKNRIFIIFILLIFVCILTMINSLITSKITNPINELEKSVNRLEMGALNIPIYEGGTHEIQHLGKSIKKMADQIQNLMKDMVEEHESKRKNELNTLQAQINPHFLYNTLDIIVWMIEDKRQEEAVKVVTALARFFRISLSKGKTIITVADELEHVRNYLMIQNMRYKNRFEYSIIAEPEVMGLATIKLVLQPLVENAIYHGMEFMDGDGEIIIKAYLEEEELYLSVSDNGLGMTEEMVVRLLTGDVSSKRGTGIGVKNVNERIRVYFGMEYGLRIDSEPDEGTTIIIHLPKIAYDEYVGMDV